MSDCFDHASDAGSFPLGMHSTSHVSDGPRKGITDAQRLDWLQKHLMGIHVFHPKPGSPKKRKFAVNPSINYEYNVHESLRDAIDEKMKEIPS